MTDFNSSYTVDHVTTKEGIEKIRPIWESMQSHPNADIDHYLNLLRTRSNIIRPDIILLHDNGKPITLVVGRIEKSSFTFKVGYKKIYSPTVRTYVIMHGGLLGDMPNRVCDVLFDEIMRPQPDGEVDLIRINYIDTDSYLYKLATMTPGIFARDYFPTIETHWRMTIPKTIDDFYKARPAKHRYWLKRMDRMLMKDYPDTVVHRCYTGGGNNELEEVLTDVEYIAKQTYQRNINVGFVDTEETRTIYSNLARKGRFRAYITYIKNEPSAFWLGELYNYPQKLDTPLRWTISPLLR